MFGKKDVYFLISICFLIGGSVMHSMGTQIAIMGRFDLGPSLFFVARIMAAVYLYVYGALRRTWWQAGIFLLLFAQIAGTLGRVQHYGWGGLFLTASAFGIPLIYTLYFAISKPVRSRNDWWKLAWVCFHFIGGWFTANTFIFNHIFPLFSTILLFAVFSDFRREEKRIVPPERTWDFDEDEMSNEK